MLLGRRRGSESLSKMTNTKDDMTNTTDDHFAVTKLVDLPGSFGDEQIEDGERCVCGDDPCEILEALQKTKNVA